jgi:hypothetical protein
MPCLLCRKSSKIFLYVIGGHRVDASSDESSMFEGSVFTGKDLTSLSVLKSANFPPKSRSNSRQKPQKILSFDFLSYQILKKSIKSSSSKTSESLLSIAALYRNSVVIQRDCRWVCPPKTGERTVFKVKGVSRCFRDSASIEMDHRIEWVVGSIIFVSGCTPEHTWSFNTSSSLLTGGVMFTKVKTPCLLLLLRCHHGPHVCVYARSFASPEVPSWSPCVCLCGVEWRWPTVIRSENKTRGIA